MSIPDLPGARWRKSSRSSAQGGDCVEIAGLGPTIAIRDSKNPDGPKLILDAASWRAFGRQIKASEHDVS